MMAVSRSRVKRGRPLERIYAGAVYVNRRGVFFGDANRAVAEPLAYDVDSLSFRCMNRANCQGGSVNTSRSIIYERHVSVSGVTLHVFGGNRSWVDQSPRAKKPDRGNTFLAVDLSVQNTGAESIGCKPSYFKIFDSDRREYRLSKLSYGPGGLLARKLLTGETARGWILFEVPADVPSLNLSFSIDGLFGTEYIRVRLW